jgi:hypothetical protein
MKKITVALISMIILAAAELWAEDAIELSPSGSYDRYTIYENLALFWIGIIGLIVIIKIKLKEIERTQSLGIDEEREDVPLLD